MCLDVLVAINTGLTSQSSCTLSCGTRNAGASGEAPNVTVFGKFTVENLGPASSPFFSQVRRRRAEPKDQGWRSLISLPGPCQQCSRELGPLYCSHIQGGSRYQQGWLPAGLCVLHPCPSASPYPQEQPPRLCRVSLSLTAALLLPVPTTETW